MAKAPGVSTLIGVAGSLSIDCDRFRTHRARRRVSLYISSQGRGRSGMARPTGGRGFEAEFPSMAGNGERTDASRPGREVLYQEPRILYILIWFVCFIYGASWIVNRSMPQPLATWVGVGWIVLTSYLWLWRARRIGVSISNGTMLQIVGLFVTRSIPIDGIVEIRCPLRGPLVVVTEAGREVAVRVGPRWGPKRERLLRDLQAELRSV